MAKPVRKFLVVARYKEDVGWVGDMAGWEPIIIQKQTEDLEGHLPNKGREPSSFFYAIVERYDDIRPNDVWAFVQGKPFDHCPNLATDLSRADGTFRWLGNPAKVSDGEGKPDHPELPVSQKHEEWLGREFSGSVQFAPGGQYVVSGEIIKKKSISFYKKLMEDFCQDYNAWVAERLWEEIYR